MDIQTTSESLEGSQKRMTLLQTLNQGSRWLTVTGFLMMADIVISIIGLITDSTLVTGAPAWLKPLKFGLSTCLFSFTVAFFIGCLSKTRLTAVVGRVLAIMLTLEIVIIDVQATRHIPSHFNKSTGLDTALYGVMGMGISVVLVCTLVLFAVSWWERFADRSLALAIRLSLGLALAGMLTGFLMTLPTPQQLADARAGRPMPAVGAHTIGASDGGPGLPLTGWSADHGDLRIAHFTGLHAMQLLILGWWLVARHKASWCETRRSRLVCVIAAVIGGVFVIELWQALRGLPLLRPDAAISASWGICLLAAVGLSVWVCLPALQAMQPARRVR